MKVHLKAGATLLGASLAVAATDQAFAQSSQAEAASPRGDVIVVTATKRPEDVQDLAISITAVSGEYLEEAGIENMAELSRFVPNLGITQSNNNRNSTVFVRGIGTSGTNPGIEASVGIFLDGVYMPAAGPVQAQLLDISTVEVLRGPQGTLYGRNTPVGAINITTRAPQDELEAHLRLGVGDYGAVSAAGYLGGGLSENLAGRITWYYSDRDGYETNLFTNADINDNRQAGVRGRLQWKLDETLTANIIAYYSQIEAHCCTADQINPTGPGGIATPGFLAAAAASGAPFRNFTGGDHIVDDDLIGFNSTEIYGTSLQVDREFASGHVLTSISAFNSYEDDIPRLSADSLPLDVGLGVQFLRSAGYSQELRLLSPAGGLFEYVAGLYFFAGDIKYRTQTTTGRQANRVFPPNRRLVAGERNDFYFTQDTTSAAAFGQLTWNLSDRARLVGGLRYNYDEKSAYLASFNNAIASAAFASVFPANLVGDIARDENNWTYTFTGQFDFTPDIMGFAGYSTGYKTGGFNARNAAPGTPFEFDAETSDTYEVGLKSLLFNRTLTFNASYYLLTLSDFQDSTLNPLTGSGFIVGNAGEREVSGVEIDSRWSPIDQLSVIATASYADASFTDYTDGQCYAGQTANGTRPGTCNYNGLRPSQSPEWRYSLAVQGRQPIPSQGVVLFANADASYVDEHFQTTTLDPRSRQKAYTLYGARLGIEAQDGRWRLSAFGKNLGDVSYNLTTSPQPVGAIISGGGTAAAGGFVGWYGPPRTYGVELALTY